MPKLLPNVVYLIAVAAWAELASGQSSQNTILEIKQDEKAETISVYRAGGKEPILTQNVIKDVRPYLHPIVAPDGRGLLTQYRPSHHLHQTGIFWGLKLVNGRDFFMKWQADHYRKVSAKTIAPKGPRVRWQTVYDMLEEDGSTVMTETQTWSMQEAGGRYLLDLEWIGEPRTNITLGKWYVGGLFVRMPWQEGVAAEAVNSVGLRNSEAEAQRAVWTDMGIQVDGRDDLAHLAIFDHPDNPGFPTSWRVDQQFGFGPDLEERESFIEKGKPLTFHYRLVAYTGKLDRVEMMRAWKEYVREVR
jgi:hypothetical protein